MILEDFKPAFGREPNEVETTWIKCIEPTPIRGGTLAPICYAYLEVDNEQKEFKIPEPWQVAVYGEVVEGCALAGKDQFTIGWTESVDPSTFIFSISANYSLSTKPPCRSRYTSAEDCNEWLPYIESVGKSIGDVLNKEEREARLPVEEDV